MKVFVSSTYCDLIDHRKAVNELLQRMKVRFSAMEFYGSRTDEAMPACKKEISSCDILIGIYAWRYGWQPTEDSPSITEEEFNYAQRQGKRCLCYLIDENYPWPPNFVDRGDLGERLHAFKLRVSRLVRSTFTTPDNLAMQIAADLVREMVPQTPNDSFGGLLRLNWEIFSPEMQTILSTAYSQARVESQDGVIATRHVVAALASLPNTARILVTGFPGVVLPQLFPDLPTPALDELFGYTKPISSCISRSLERLLPLHSPAERLLAIELAVDLLKNGTGTSVTDFRRAGVDKAAVDTMMGHIKAMAENREALFSMLLKLTDAEVIYLAYVSGINVPEKLEGSILRNEIIKFSKEGRKTLVLAGELMRRYPGLLDMKDRSRAII